MDNVLKSIRLDHEITKSRYPLFLVGYVIGIIFSVVTKTPVLAATIVMAIAAPMTGQCFAIYEKNNLDKLYGVLPIKKSEVVVGRYLFALGIVIINGVFAFLLSLIMAFLTGGQINGIESITFMAGGFLYFCLMIAVAVTFRHIAPILPKTGKWCSARLFKLIGIRVFTDSKMAT